MSQHQLSENLESAFKELVQICPACMLHAKISLNFGKELSESFTAIRTDAQKVVERLYRQNRIDRTTYEDLTLEVKTHPDLHDTAAAMDAMLGELSIVRVIQQCHPKNDYPEIASIRLRPPLVPYN